MERVDALLLGGPLHGITLPTLPTTQRVEVAAPTVRDPAAIGRYRLVLPRTFPLIFRYEETEGGRPMWHLIARLYDHLVVHDACPCCWGGRLGDRFCAWMDVRVYAHRRWGQD